MITMNIFLSSLNVKRTILLIQAVPQDGKLPWCWLYEKFFFCYNAANLHLFSRSRVHSVDSQYILYQYSFRIVLEFIKTRMRYRIILRLLTGFYVLVQHKYQRLLKLCFEYVVHVDDNWMLRHLNNTRIAIVYCPLFLSLVMHFLYSTPLSLNTLYILSFSHLHVCISLLKV